MVMTFHEGAYVHPLFLLLQMNDSVYTEIFHTSGEEIAQVLRTALSSGGDFSDLYFEYSVTNNLVLMDGQVNSAYSNIDYGVGVRVVKGERTGYAYSEKTTLEDMLRAAGFAAQINGQAGIVAVSPRREVSPTVHIASGCNFYPVTSPWEDHTVTERALYLQKLQEAVFSGDERVVKLIGRIADQQTYILYADSEGRLMTDSRPLGSLSATVIMNDGDRTENFYNSRSFRQGFEFLNDSMVSELARNVVDGCSFLFGASQPTPGQMPVIIGSGGGGILLHEAIGHAFEADFNRKNVSIFSDRMGQRICREGINIVDDGTLIANRGSLNFDDEGIPSQKTYMVKDGVLNSFLHDRISAGFYGVDPTGNGRRESFRFMPVPRMRATYMENGTSDEESLIRDVRKGIYVDNFSNGQVQIGAGDFTFFVKSGYMIENGHLTRPIKDCNIIGNGPQALSDIVAVADNLKMENGTWTCGKGQNVPVCCGMPTVMISRLNVGGINL